MIDLYSLAIWLYKRCSRQSLTSGDSYATKTNAQWVDAMLKEVSLWLSNYLQVVKGYYQKHTLTKT